MSSDTVAVAKAVPIPVVEAPKAPRNRMAALDGMRFIAASAVLAYHYLGDTEGIWGRDPGRVFPSEHHATSYGFLGVEFFFLISGFVICMSSWGKGLGSFFASRVSRLYPAYWAAVTLTTLIFVWNPAAGSPLRLDDYFSNMTMLHFSFGVASASGVYWTLWLELRFYLLFALVVWRGVTYRRVVAFCLLWTAASVLVPAFNSPILHGIVQEDYSPYFIGGITMYLMHRYRPNPLLWLMLGTQWVLAQHQVAARVVEGSRLTGAHLSWNGGVILITVFFLAVLAVALGWLDWANWRWLTVLGTLTYPLYLVHSSVGQEIIKVWYRKAHHPNAWVILAVATASSLAVAWLIQRFIEKPFGPRLRKAVQRSLKEINLPEPALRAARAAKSGTSAGASVATPADVVEVLSPPAPRGATD